MSDLARTRHPWGAPAAAAVSAGAGRPGPRLAPAARPGPRPAPAARPGRQPGCRTAGSSSRPVRLPAAARTGDAPRRRAERGATRPS